MFAAVAPSSAQAFTGEGSVIEGSHLTKPAETILEKPTFITENVGEARAALGVDEAGAVAATDTSMGLLPAMGPALLAFGAGVGVGSAICNVVGIEGCWLFESTEAKPEYIATEGLWKEGLWVFKEATGVIEDPVATPYTWYWEFHFSNFEQFVKGHSPCEEAYIAPTPSKLLGPVKTGTTCYDGKAYVATPRYAVSQSSMQGRSFKHSKTNGGLKESSFKAPSNWSEKSASALKGASGTSTAGRVGEKIASEIAGSGASDPYATVKVPSCAGMKAPACEVELEELKLKPVPVELDWEDAVIEELDLLEPEKTREKESERVTELVPPPGFMVVPGKEVVIEQNPATEGMPLIVPEDPAPGEDEESFRKRRLIPMLPLWLLNPEMLSDATLNPHYGPNAVVRPVPKPGTRMDPSVKEAELTVQTNPSTAPAPAGAWSPPAIPAVDLTPLASVSIGCTTFPFGVFCWIGAGLTAWGTSGTCPNVSVPIHNGELEVDFCEFEPAMEIIRPVLIVLAIFSLAWLFSRAALGIGGDSDD